MPKTNADGTSAARFQINHDLDGPAIKDEAGVLAARNAADSNYAKLRVANPDPTSAQDAVNVLGHEITDTLAHEVAEDYDLEVNRNGSGDVDRATYWVAGSGRTVKIRETTITYDGNLDVSVATTVQYDAAGVAVVDQTVLDSVTRNGGGDVITVAGAES